MNFKKIIVVGGGPSGMMAAIRAAELGQDVTLIEKNAFPGKKLLLSGKGRCNLTNTCTLDSFIQRFHHGEFLRDAFRKFFHQDLIGFFESRGLKLKVERQARVFPETDRANSVLEVLKKELRRNNIHLFYQASLREVVVQEGKVKGLLLDTGKFLEADKLILATGGVSYSFTGSTGEALEIVKKLGHRILPLKAGLVPLETKERYPRLLAGLALKNIRLKFSNARKVIISDIGELLFTHFGISGPLVLTFSAAVADWLNDGCRVNVAIDLKPALSREQLDSRLLREFRLNSKKGIKNTLKELLPKRLIEVFLEMAKINPDKKVNQISQKEREGIVDLLKAFSLQVTRTRPMKEAMITRGGVSLKEINPKTMESRLIKGLYFAGEMIDVDADTGGFNLQAAFSTGYLAGESAALS